MAQLNEPFEEPTANERSPKLQSVAHEMSESIKAVIRSEFHLAKAELKENGTQAASYGKKMVIFGGVAILGIFPLLSFIVIGLGRLLNDNYWLSSLIVAAALFIVGGSIAYLMLKRIKSVDFRFENTRDSVVTQLKTVDRKLHEVTDVAKTKASLKTPRRASS
jgi:uncharacterized membrane protein YqjE